jgi:hypothetical protein
MKIVGLIILLFIASCSPKQEIIVDIPKNLISRDTMVLLLIETQIVEAANAKRMLIQIQDENALTRAYLETFHRFGITKEQFEESLTYYKYNLAEFELMIDEAVSQVSIITTKVEQE